MYYYISIDNSVKELLIGHAYCLFIINSNPYKTISGDQLRTQIGRKSPGILKFLEGSAGRFLKERRVRFRQSGELEKVWNIRIKFQQHPDLLSFA